MSPEKREVFTKPISKMRPIAQAIAGARWSRTNILMSGAVILFVIGMFFIPELIDFQRSVSGASTASQSDVVVVEATQEMGEKIEVATRVGSDPLREISAMLDEDNLERASYRFERKELEIPSELLTPEQIVEYKERREAQVELATRPLTWESFGKKATAGALSRSRAQAIGLMKEIRPENEATRFSLVNYINGIRAVELRMQRPKIEAVQDIREVGITPEDAYAYLETLDAAVTRSMVREGVDRSVYLKWRDVNLGPLFETSRLAREKLQYRMPFNPGLTLERVQVYKPGPKYKEDGRAYVHIYAFARGKDIKRISYYEDGVFRGNVALHKPDRDGLRKFRLKAGNARSVITFVAHDIVGETFEKSYHFYPKVKRFAWTPRRAGTFLVNFPSGLDSPALDQFFRYHGGLRGSRSSQEYRGFVTF